MSKEEKTKGETGVFTKEKEMHFTDDILMEILLRIPWRSVAQLRSVSKHWLQLTSESRFILNHQSRNGSLLGFYNDNERIVNFIPTEDWRFQLPHLVPCPPYSNIVVVNSSNGWLLLYTCRYYRTGLYFLHNPITRQDVLLPPPLLSNMMSRTPLRAHGFAIDQSFDPAYVTVLELSFQRLGLRVNAYTSETGEWRGKFHQDNALLPLLGWSKKRVCKISAPSTFFKGSLHWLCFTSDILAYDVKAKRFRLFNTPIAYNSGNLPFNHHYESKDDQPRYPAYLMYVYLGECRERLMHTRITSDSELLLWTQEDYYLNIWSPMRRVMLHNLPASLTFGSVIAFDPKDPLVVYLRLHMKIMTYHLESGTLKELADLTEELMIRDRSPFLCPFELPRSPISVLPQRDSEKLHILRCSHGDL